jgi:hypothetical protein
MNKTFVGILIGLLLGFGGAWLLRSHASAEPAKAEAVPAAAEKPKDNPLKIPPAKREKLGIVLSTPAEQTLTPEVTAFGRVLDATALITVSAELTTAQASVAASDSALDRIKKLFATGDNASAQAVEAAQLTATQNKAALASARVRLLANWGRDIAKNIENVSQALENGASLARLDVLPGETPAATPKKARLRLPGSSDVFDADVLGAAPVADPQVQGASFLVLIADHPLPVGAALRATLPGVGEATPSLVIPRSAVVYHQGSAWVYALGEENTFERKIVTLGREMSADKVTIMGGLEASEQVVTKRAQHLLSAELQAGGAPVED